MRPACDGCVDALRERERFNRSVCTFHTRQTKLYTVQMPRDALTCIMMTCMLPRDALTCDVLFWSNDEFFFRIFSVIQPVFHRSDVIIRSNCISRRNLRGQHQSKRRKLGHDLPVWPTLGFPQTGKSGWRTSVSSVLWTRMTP